MRQAVEEESNTWLMETLRCLASRLNADDIQDIFEAEMSNDGYFKPLAPDPDCPDCGGTGYVTQSTGAFSYRAPCLCNPEHGSHHQ
jgi:hypothetical protein